MLSRFRIHATLPARDLERAKVFYSDKLGLTPAKEAPGGLVYECGGSSYLLVFPSQGTSSGTHTQAGWTVNDIDSIVAELRSRGVAFESYEFPQFDKETGIATFEQIRSAWFKDSEGNVLGVVEFVDPAASF